MLYPIIGDYTDYANYFKDFYTLNKDAGTPMSFRNLANKLGWPFSYFSDVVHGRRNLTAARAIEFATFAKFNSIETERLVFMIFKDSNHHGVQEFFSNKLSIGHNSDNATDKEKINAGYADDYESCIEELRDDIHAGVLLKYLFNFQGKIQKNKVGKILFTFPEFNEMSFLNERLDRLVRNKNIEIISDNGVDLEVKILRPVLHFKINKENIHNISAFTDCMGRILRSPKVKGSFNNGFVRIHPRHFSEAVERMNILRNWLIEVEKEEVGPEKICLLFEYGFNLAAAVDTDELGVYNLIPWADLK
jgi:hypothetical protein